MIVLFLNMAKRNISKLCSKYLLQSVKELTVHFSSIMAVKINKEQITKFIVTV